MASKQNKQRTYARNRLITRRGNVVTNESDGQYLLKLVLVIILGTLWLKFEHPLWIGAFPVGAVPVGMIFGLLVVSRMEKLQFDRKIWYAILLVVTVISYIGAAGIVI